MSLEDIDRYLNTPPVQKVWDKEDAKALFNNLFNDQTPVNTSETHSDESDPELAELFEDIDDEVNLPDKPVYVTAQGRTSGRIPSIRLNTPQRVLGACT
ncbi:hypothetical protein L1987_09534 [Smallanthus sonchifolius]|uniref:Uncharacterized protein n=1 Tax=Smallanthus sonchifolius TaxID=185202 RepID=A0ACB9JPN8_9ASTR|nr:hypothetical protein L1987_09534 [Smallanthus sonchifolius]